MRFRILCASAIVGAGLTVPTANAQVDVGGTVREALNGAARGAATGRDVGNAAVRGAVRGATGLNNRFSYRNRRLRADDHPPRFDARAQADARFNNDFNSRFGRNVDRNRFRYNDGSWWYQTNDNDWIYDRNGEWHYRDGRPYDGFDARNVGYRHPNYRYHNDHWWYKTGNDWVFFNDGRWYRTDGRSYASARSNMSLTNAPSRVDLFMGQDGRQYRYHNDHWWYRDGGDWFFNRDGHWYDQQNQRTGAINAALQAQFRNRMSGRRNASADVAANTQSNAATDGTTNADSHTSVQADVGANAESYRSEEFPPPPAEAEASADTDTDADGRFDGELPTAPTDTTDVETDTTGDVAVNRQRNGSRDAGVAGNTNRTGRGANVERTAGAPERAGATLDAADRAGVETNPANAEVGKADVSGEVEVDASVDR